MALFDVAVDVVAVVPYEERQQAEAGDAAMVSALAVVPPSANLGLLKRTVLLWSKKSMIAKILQRQFQTNSLSPMPQLIKLVPTNPVPTNVAFRSNSLVQLAS